MTCSPSVSRRTGSTSGRWRFACWARPAEADDAVQEAWLRLSRTDADAVDNLGGWLTTVVARVCLDMLRARARKHEVPPEDRVVAPPRPGRVTSPEDEALLADSVGLALLVVLDTLAPAERLAFVLHDMFGVPFEEIAADRRADTVGRPAAGQPGPAAGAVGPRCPRRLRRHASARSWRPSSPRSRHGDFAGLLRLLDPDVVVRADEVTVEMAASRVSMGAPELHREMRGVDAVTRAFAGGAKAARLSLIDGLAGAVVSVGGRALAVFDFTLRDGLVVGIDLLSDPDTLAVLDLQPVAR